MDGENQQSTSSSKLPSVNIVDNYFSSVSPAQNTSSTATSGGRGASSQSGSSQQQQRQSADQQPQEQQHLEAAITAPADSITPKNVNNTTTPSLNVEDQGADSEESSGYSYDSSEDSFTASPRSSAVSADQQQAQQQQADATSSKVEEDSATLLPSSSPSVFRHFLRGLYDAVNVYNALKLFWRSKKLKKLFFKCLVLNGFIFLGSIIFLEYIMAPFVRRILQEHEHYYQASFFQYFFKSVYNVLWLYPMYSLSFIMNTVWYSDVATESYRLSRKQKDTSTSLSYKRLIQSLSEEIYRLFIIMFFMLQTFAIAFIPYVGPILSFLSICWLYAFYSFEYVWSNRGVPLLKRVQIFEHKWAYFAGFGTPNALATFFFPFFINNGIWALLFPLFIVLAIRSNVPPLPANTMHIPIFWASRVLSEFFLKLFSYMRGGRAASTSSAAHGGAGTPSTTRAAPVMRRTSGFSTTSAAAGVAVNHRRGRTASLGSNQRPTTAVSSSASASSASAAAAAAGHNN
eukprot:GEZU01025021.1.p1 GENE.GEZU01025021.1~~GEZU01025021.1.p1  ORF type:complete len:515 (+),score=100.46 GEZU01025021.1:106-1650(+)